MSILDDLGMTKDDLRESLADVPPPRGMRHADPDRIAGDAILREGLRLDERLYHDNPPARTRRPRRSAIREALPDIAAQIEAADDAA